MSPSVQGGLEDGGLAVAESGLTVADGGVERATRAVVRQAIAAYAEHPELADRLRRHLARLDEPLRVAIAGKVKAGKSTLLNALVGEEIAATDAGECTQVLTWYEYGTAPRVMLHDTSGAAHQMPIERVGGRLHLDLDGRPPDEVDRLVVDWPSSSLRGTTLIDTPGIDSLSTEISARSTAFLTPVDEPSEADAIVYLLRHLHSSDIRFLESFHDQAVGRATMINTVGVLSRADEIGSGRLDAMISANKVARRYSADPTLRQLCQTVIPLAGLLAQAGRTLRQREYQALEALADCPRDVTQSLLLSVDRFVRSNADVPVDSDTRRELLDRLGVYGVRLSITMIRGGLRDATALSEDLVRRSGLDGLRELLAVQFTERRNLLKARSALLGVERMMREHPLPDLNDIRIAIERILAGAHEFRELGLLSRLRSPGVGLPPDVIAEAERLLGGQGTSAEARLGMGRIASTADIRAGASAAVRRWRVLAEDPLTDRPSVVICQTVARSCEGILAAVPA